MPYEFPEDAMALDQRSAGPPGTPLPLPEIPDHKLLRCIGRGSYGEVWLARNVVGTHRAVKVVYRKSFERDRPYDREFAGIQKFEPISRSHEGFVDILQIGRNDEAGYFYYVMELADDASVGKASSLPVQRASLPEGSDAKLEASPLAGRMPALHFNQETYSPRTLRSLLRPNSQPSTLNAQPTTAHLPLAQCLDIGLALTTALAYLHKHGLVHRDIKPSNIIFVDGAPKLADIGLVADVSEARSFVGTEGFIPPEGPGTPQSDLYSLGKVLYEISTGKDRHDFPELPPAMKESAERAGLSELNEIILKACAGDVRERYQNAEAMHADLALLQRGQSVKRQRAVESRLALAKKLSLVAGALALLATGGWLLSNRFDISARQRPIAPSEVTSIAVVPFANEDKRVRSGYLSLSLAEGVTTALTNVAGLRVAPLANVLAFRRQTNDAPDIGRQLGVQWVLQAIFRNDLATRSNQMIAVTKLTHLPDGIQVWSVDYDRTLDDLVGIQRDVLDNVAHALGVSIPAPAIERMETNLLSKVEAWKLAERGDQHLRLRTREGFTEGARLLHQALEIDPTFIFAHQLLSLAYLSQSERHLPPHQAMPEARSRALRALELESSSPFAHCMLGVVKLSYDWDLEGAGKEFRRGIELDPYGAANHANNAGLLRVLGRLSEASVEQELAVRLDPTELTFVVGLVGQAIAEKKYDAALELSQELLVKHPEYVRARYSLGRAYEKKGLYDQAMAEYRQLRAMEDGPEVLAMIGHLHALRGEREEALRFLGELERLGKSSYVSPVFQARIHLRLGDRMKALELLEQARDERCGSLTMLKIDEDWDSLRDEPRFQALLKQVGLEKLNALPKVFLENSE